MGLSLWGHSEAAIWVSAAEDVGRCFWDVDGGGGERSEEAECAEGAVDEAGVLFAPFVAGEAAGVGVLEGGDVPDGGGGVDAGEGVDGREDLDGGEGVEDVGVMAGAGTEAATGVLAGFYEFDGGGAGEGGGVVEEVEGGEAPVDTGEAEVRGEVIVEVVFVGVERLDVGDVFVDLEEGGHGVGMVGRGG